MPTVVSEYEKKVHEKAINSTLTYDTMNANTIVKLLDGRFKCNCCDSVFKYELQVREHIEREVHKKNISHHNIVKQLEKSLNAERNRNRSLTEKVRELEDELFQYKGSTRIECFLSECEECDYIQKEEDLEIVLPNGMTTTTTIPVWIAPTTFDEIYDAFCKWSENTFTGNNCRESVKKYLIEYQEKSSYGITIGTYDEEMKKNGTYDNPRFNFKFEFSEK